MNNNNNKNNSCPLYKKCGGCQLQNLSYLEQLEHKQRMCNRFLDKFCVVDKIIGMENPLHYRNKVQAAFGLTRTKEIVSGVYQSGTHRIVPVDNCMIENSKADKIIVTIRKFLKSFKLSVYDEDTGVGFLRHVLVRCGIKTGEFMVVLVAGTTMFPSKNNFVKALIKAHPEVTTIVLNINNQSTNLVLGERQIVLYGKGYIEDIMCDRRFRLSPKSFYQINSAGTEILYNTAMKLAGLTGEERVIDAYCGIGTIGLVAAKDAKEVIGVEHNREAIRDAVNNAKLNNAENTKFYCADAGDFMVELAERGEGADVVFMDPPRSGSDPNFLSSLKTLSPKKIVYISCNPETLSRDLEFLVKGNGYRVKTISPVDMFPYTNHVECVVLINRNHSEKAY